MDAVELCNECRPPAVSVSLPTRGKTEPCISGYLSEKEMCVLCAETRKKLVKKRPVEMLLLQVSRSVCDGVWWISL